MACFLGFFAWVCRKTPILQGFREFSAQPASKFAFAKGRGALIFQYSERYSLTTACGQCEPQRRVQFQRSAPRGDLRLSARGVLSCARLIEEDHHRSTPHRYLRQAAQTPPK